MFAEPPKIVSLIIKTDNIEVMENFYFLLGMLFNKGVQENGLRTFYYINDYYKFELRETSDILKSLKT